MKIKYQILSFMCLLVIIPTVTLSVFFLNTQKKMLLDGIDNKLYMAASFAKNILPESYHENIADEYSVSEDDFNKIVDTNNKLCLKFNLQYLWSVMTIGDQIVFTSSTSPGKNIKQDDHAKFFDLHQDPRAFDEVFSTKKTVFNSFENEWGHGRMVLIPYHDSKGRPYCFGASMNVSAVNSMIIKTTTYSMIISMVIFIIGLFISFALASSFSKPITELTDVSKKVALGNFTRSIKVGGNLELKSLSESINSMNLAIRSKIEEAVNKNTALEQEVKERRKAQNSLREVYDELEQKVHTRTLELKKAIDQLNQEIEERVRTEAAIQESENRFRALANFLPQTVWEIDVNGYFTFVNDEGFRVFGYTLEEMKQGVNAADLFVPEDRDRAMSNALKMLNGEKVRPAEYYLLKKDQTLLPVIMYMNPIVRGGKITGLRGMHVDISDRKLREKELRKSHDQFQSLVTNIPGVTYRCKPDENWTMSFMSAKIEQLTGYPATDFIDNSLRYYASVIHPDDSETVAQVVSKAIKSGTHWEVEYRINHKDGSVKWVYETGGGIRGSDGQIEYLDGFILDITERKNTEQDLHETHSLLKGVIAQSPIPMAVASPDGELKIFNEALNEQLGIDATSGIKPGVNIYEMHQPWRDYGLDGKVIPVEKLPLAMALRGETVKNLEMRVVRSDGSERWQIVNGRPIHDNEGKLIAGFVSFPDITRRKQAEALVRESEMRLRALSEASFEAIFFSDKGLCVDQNHTAERMFGYNRAEAAGRPGTDWIVPEDREQVIRKMLSGYEKPYEVRGLRKDGTTFPCEIQARMIDHRGKSIRTTVLRDITDRKQALAATKEARDRIENILTSVTDGLIVIDAYNRIELMNPAAENLLGITLNEMMGHPVEMAIKDSVLRDRFTAALDMKSNGYQFDFELPGPEPQKPRVMRARASVVQGNTRSKSGIIMIIEDVTYEREIDRMKTEFISTAAHELKTPLTSIKGFSEILVTRDDIDPGEKKKFLAHINEQSDELTAIINDLLDVTRIESGQGFALNKKACVAGDCIRCAIAPFEKNNPNHSYEVTLPENKVQLQADPDKLGQVMKNLLSNATKYSPNGGPVRVTGRVREAHYHVTVEDEGIGMTPAQVENVFDKFYRVDATNTAVEGTGLGMSIVKYIVEAHGGTVQVESQLGKGSVVEFSLPLTTGRQTANQI